ncbi:MAG TPA: sulfurtransferase, partial [Thioalkalivibrio sp.]|nr:sulfurtransferase [Thioalkalivibrio sp.]
LDVREPWEFELARIDGSELLPLGQLPARLDELDSSRETVVICHHGVRSMQAAFFLQARGFKTVINLAGGIDAWSREVDPTIPVY